MLARVRTPVPTCLAVLLATAGCAGSQAQTATPARLLVTDDHSCVITEEGALDCWGWGPTLEFMEREFRGVVGPVEAAALESDLTYVLMDDGRIHDGLGVHAPEFLQDASPVDVAESCAVLADGRVRCWSGRPEPFAIPRLRDDVVELSGSFRTGCTRSSTGALRCWDHGWKDKTHTLLGVPRVVDLATTGPRGYVLQPSGRVVEISQGWRVPKGRVRELRDAVEIAANHWNGCAIQATGRVGCWIGGYRGHHSPIVPGSSDASLPLEFVEIPGIDDAVEIAVGPEHACARVRDGGVRCWGDNHHRQLGDAAGRAWVDAPTRITGLPPVATLELGTTHACARTEAGQLWCWGARAALDPDPTPPLERVHTPPIEVASAVEQAWVAGGLTCVRGPDSTLDCWGRVEGQFVVADGFPRLSPEARELALSERWACTLGPAGAACLDLRGVLALRWPRPRNEGRDAPAPVIEGALASVELDLEAGASIASLSAGPEHACALIDTGQVQCWTGDEPTPAPIAGLPPVTALALGRGYACALEPAGQAWCWAWDPREPPQPRSIVGPPAMRSIAAGEALGCGLSERGVAWCWGPDDDRPPSPVPGLDALAEVAIGGRTACARDPAGAVWCWGANLDGQADPTTPMTSAEPVEVADVRKVRMIEAQARPADPH